MSRPLLKIVLSVAVLFVGGAAAWLLASARQAPPRMERRTPGPLVEVVTTALVDVPVVVRGNGEVGAKVAVEVVPEVSGRVIEAHPSLVAGGRFSRGQALVIIEPRDYELAVERARATVARAQVTLERELAEAEAARSEWATMHPGEEPSSPLVVREPQVRQASAELDAARAELSSAELSLERTQVSVPFDGIVVAESVDVGQYVTPGRAIASVYGTESVEVRLPLEDGELAWFDVPTLNGGRGPRAEVSAAFAGARQVWQGRVVRMEGEVDQSSRMVHVVVEVRDPFAGPQPPLLPGTFVDVAIHGRILAGVIPVPRHAVHEGGRVWVVEDGQLRIREVEVARSDRETAFVTGGLDSGAQVVISALDAVTDGMAVRTAGSGGEAVDGGAL